MPGNAFLKRLRASRFSAEVEKNKCVAMSSGGRGGAGISDTASLLNELVQFLAEIVRQWQVRAS